MFCRPFTRLSLKAQSLSRRTADASHSNIWAASVADQIKPGKFEDWARESFEITKEELYPSSLRRDRAPSVAYRKTAIAIAKERVALGGYRLAALLTELLFAN